MLHELFLALSGHSSPLLDQGGKHALTDLLSPSERTLLHSLACLGSSQARIRNRCSHISNEHPSTVCRAACSFITASHLTRFTEKVIEVESAILQSDAKYVGAYDIVPLSAIVAAFDGWDRVLKWLERLVERIGSAETQAGGQHEHSFMTGAQVIDYLQSEIHTGYPEIEDLAASLLNVAQATWIRQLTPWLLYGRLPPYGTEDFFIRHTSSGNDDFVVDQPLAPSILDTDTAFSILFIGRSLQHIQRGYGKSPASTAELEAAESVLLVEHLSLLESLELPLTTFTLSTMVAKMRSSLSQNALQKLLPFSDIVRLLDMLRQFFLLERGEFAVALIEAADECLASRHIRTNSSKDRGRLGGMMIKDGEVNSVLSRTWASLVALQDINDDIEDEDLEYAREIVDFSIRRQSDDSKLGSFTSPSSRVENPASLFDDVLLATPTTLTVMLEAPLDIFLSEQDVQDYSLLHAYLLGIRRAHLHLAELWKLSSLRRIHPAPKGRKGEAIEYWEAARGKSNARAKTMRGVWAAIAHARFFFAQINDYFQGEVVRGSTQLLQRYIGSEGTRKQTISRPATGQATSASGTAQARLNDAHDSGPANNVAEKLTEMRLDELSKLHHDPEALATAHRQYLAQLKDSLLLNETRFLTSMRNLMTRVNHATALIQRLAVVTQITSLAAAGQEPQSSHVQEEAGLMRSLESVRKSINGSLEELTKNLRDLDDRKRMGVLPSQQVAADAAAVATYGHAATARAAFMPWQGPGLSRLLMRLESGNLGGGVETMSAQ